MLYGLLVSLFIVICFFLLLIILIQQGKGNMGLGSLGGATQMIFGGSGGADIFQKITWILGVLFMAGSLVLALMKSANYGAISFVKKPVAVAEQPAQLPMESEASQAE